MRTDRYTYVVYKETGEHELYDRKKDPDELRNVAADPAYAKVGAPGRASSRSSTQCKGGAAG